MVRLEKGLKAGSDLAEEAGKGSVLRGENQKSWREAQSLQKASLEYLKESITLCVEQLRKPKVHGKTKIKWAHCLAQQIAALVNLMKVMGVEDDEDLILWLSGVKKKVPKKYIELVDFRRF